MGNSTDENNWAARIRLGMIERALWWRGHVRRADLIEQFQISLAQSSSDLQRYFELNPAAAVYNTRKKMYEALPEMVCVLHSPVLEAALEMIPGGIVPATGWPRRQAPQAVQRQLVVALLGGHVVRVKLEGEPEEREIIPSGLDKWEGRWFLRARSLARSEWLTLAVDQIEAAGWPKITSVKLPNDPSWVQMDELEICLRGGPALDYAGPSMTVQFRRALRAQILARLPEGFVVVPG